MSKRVVQIAEERDWGSLEGKVAATGRYLRRNPSLILGIFLLFMLIIFASLGRLVVDVSTAEPLSALPGAAPSAEYPLGTDSQGRNLIAVMIVGTWLTIRTGLIAGGLGLILGCVIGMTSAYIGGRTDKIVTWILDVLITVPAILFLVMVSSVVQTGLTSMGMALIIAALAWRRPARQLRSQMLMMRSAGYVEMAKLSGAGTLRIITTEIAPNLMPFLVSSFVTAVAAAILAGIGLEAMGLGPQNEPTLGMTIYWIMAFSAFLQGMWWWILPPIVILIILFVSLYLINTGLDELANPRLRRRA